MNTTTCSKVIFSPEADEWHRPRPLCESSRTTERSEEGNWAIVNAKVSSTSNVSIVGIGNKIAVDRWANLTYLCYKFVFQRVMRQHFAYKGINLDL